MFKKKNRDIALRHNCSEVRVRLAGRRLNGGQGAYIGRITASQSMPYLRTDGKTGMSRSK